jgi:hypothetical protein
MKHCAGPARFALVACCISFATWISPARAICDGDTLLVNHNGTFESAYTELCRDADEGAFAEGFTGSGTVCGVQFFYCNNVWYDTDEVFVFVWESEDGHPGAILAMQPGHAENIPICWGQTLANDVPITATVAGEFFVGVSQCSQDWPSRLLADLDGSASGDQCWINRGGVWSRVNDVWPDGVRALSLGVYLDKTQSPAAPDSWGTIKRLFRR